MAFPYPVTDRETKGGSGATGSGGSSAPSVAEFEVEGVSGWSGRDGGSERGGREHERVDRRERVPITREARGLGRGQRALTGVSVAASWSDLPRASHGPTSTPRAAQSHRGTRATPSASRSG